MTNTNDTDSDPDEDDGTAIEDENETAIDVDVEDAIDEDVRETLPEEVVGRAIELGDRAEEILDGYFGSGAGEADRNALEDLAELVEETEELLETADLSELPEAVDASELDEAIEGEDAPEALRELDPSEAIAFRKLLKVIELGEVFDSVDVREFWRNKRELEDEYEDVTDYAPDDEDEEEPEEQFDFVDEDYDAPELDPDLGTLDEDETGQGKQAAVQKEVSDAVGEFRESLLAAHARLDRMVEENEERTRHVGTATSRNPTAVSTMARSRPDMGGGTRGSTVPEETRYSNAPNRRRIYGRRFEEELEDVEGDDE